MNEQKTVNAGGFEISNRTAFSLIAGPCQIESRDHAMMMAEQLANICQKLDTKLESALTGRSDIAIRVVEIVDWKSECERS